MANALANLMLQAVRQAREAERQRLIASGASVAPRPPVAQLAQAGAPGAASAPAAELAPLAAVLRQARENLDAVAEAEARLIAAGHVSIDTFERQAKALEFLSGRQAAQSKVQSDSSAKFTQALTGVQKSMLATAATLTGSFAELRGLASAASPGMFSAMDGALRLLSAQLGSVLLPTMADVTSGVMQAADWFEGLGHGSKEMIAAAAVGAPLLYGLSHAIQGLSPAAQLAGKAIQGLTGSAKATRLAGLAGGGLGTAAAGALSVYAIVQMARQHTEHYASEVERQQAASGQVSGADLREALRVSRKTGNGDSISQDQLAAMSPEQRNAYYQRRADYLAEKGRRMRGHWWATQGEVDEYMNASLIFRRAAQSGTVDIREKKQEALIGEGSRLQMMIREMQRSQAPRYSPLEDARKQMQLAILGQSPFEQKLLEIQRRNLPNMVRRLGDIMRQLEEMNRRDRGQGQH